MTDQDESDPMKAGELAQQIVKLLKGEASATRQRALQAALLLLGETNTSSARDQIDASAQATSSASESGGIAELFGSNEELKPSDHAQLCAAHHFSIYGSAPFSLTELRSIASEAGVILPDRLDMTLRAAQRKGKKLFQPVRKGIYKPTTIAGLYFSERWGVKPGRAPKDTSGQKANGA